MILQHRIAPLTDIITRMTERPHPRTIHALNRSPVVRVAEEYD